MPKNAQISESDIGNPQSWENFPCLCNFKFLGVFLNKLNQSQASLKKKFFLFEWIYHKKRERTFLRRLCFTAMPKDRT